MAPERLNNEGFVEMITAVKVRLIAIDEAHCISEWGHAFRPDYLKGNIEPVTAVLILTKVILSSEVCQRSWSGTNPMFDCNRKPLSSELEVE